MSKELIEALEKALTEIKKAAVSAKTEPSDQHLLDDGWIRHTGDVCPAPPEDKVSFMFISGAVHGQILNAKEWWWTKTGKLGEITHYKVTKAYDPHEENKKLYAQDALEYEKPWELWEYEKPRKLWEYKNGATWCGHHSAPLWMDDCQYRRRQTKKLVDWSCPLLKGASTNFGELLCGGLYGAWLCSGALQAKMPAKDLRLLPLANDKSNWQAYNGEDLNLLHEAGFVVEVSYWSTVLEKYRRELFKNILPMANSWLKAYRVISIRDGFTDNKGAV